MPPNSPSKRLASLRAMQIPPLFQKNLNPPPRNEILDTPLQLAERRVMKRDFLFLVQRTVFCFNYAHAYLYSRPFVISLRIKLL